VIIPEILFELTEKQKEDLLKAYSKGENGWVGLKTGWALCRKELVKSANIQLTDWTMWTITSEGINLARLIIEEGNNIPLGYCQCGCGNRTNFNEGKYRKFCRWHHTRGALHYKYNMGLWFDKKKGRWYINCRDGSSVLYYRAVMEAHLKRELEEYEIVHHINGKKTDDVIENLELTNHHDHALKHESYKNNRPSRKGVNKYSDSFILLTLIDYCKENGKMPTRKEYDELNRKPCSMVISRRFGRFKNATRKAEELATAKSGGEAGGCTGKDKGGATWTR